MSGSIPVPGGRSASVDGRSGSEGGAVPRRILVSGASGAGKSTLAREISRVLALPYTELDALYHGPGWTPRASFVAEATAIAQSDAWVSEWQYRSVKPLLLARAQLLVCLDYTRPLVTRRVIGRTLRRRLGRQVLWNGNTEPPLRTIFSDREHIVRWSWSTFGRNRALARELAADPPAGLHVLILRSPRETRSWLEAIRGQAEESGRDTEQSG